MGGASLYVQEMSRRFVRDGHRVDVFTTDCWDLDYLFYPDRPRIEASEEIVDGVRVRRFPVFHAARKRMLRKLPAGLLRRYSDMLYGLHCAILPGLWRELLRGREAYDLIHATPSPHFYLVYPALRRARRLKVPFVFTPFMHLGTPRGRGQFDFQTSPRRLAITRRADLLIAQTSIEGAALSGVGIPEERIGILGMGVNPDDLSGGSGARFRARHDIGRDEGLLLFVGTLTLDKGSFHLLDAFRMLLERGARVRLAMAGHPSADFEKYFEAQPDRVRKGCILTGNIRGQEKKDLFHASDLLAMPSRADSYGIAYLEAWLAKKPVIGCFAGGVPEVIRDGEDGFLVPFGDAHMLSEYILLLIGNRELAGRMGERGYEKVISGCTWDMRYERLGELFHNVLEARGRAARAGGGR